MDIILQSLAVIVILASIASVTLTIRNEISRRKRERTLTEAVNLANDALAAELGKRGPRVVQATEVDPESPLGRQIIKALGLDEPCQCPNCEEGRRIAHAESKQDGESK